jgi:outer membrane protein assembly factor BamB
MLGVVVLPIALLQAANPGPPEGQPLFEAARAGDVARVRELVESGLDPDTEYRWGMTPLNAAAGWGRLEVVRYLLARGADPNSFYSFHGVSPLEAALEGDHGEVARVLLEAGARQREAALDAAIRADDLPLARAAVASGPLLASALEEARRAGHDRPALLALLETAVARPDPPPPQLTRDELQRYALRFESWEGEGEAEVRLADAGLELAFGGGVDALVPAAEDVFRSADGRVEVRFWGRAGSLEGLTLRQEGAEPVAMRESLADVVSPSADASSGAAGSDHPATVHWPGFRGANADGIGDGGEVPVRWSLETGENVLWKRELPGLGNSSPVVWGDRVFVTTALAQGVDQEIETGLTGDPREVEEAVEHVWLVLAFDKHSGERLWATEVGRGVPLTRRHFKASQANATPATDGETLVAVFPTAGMAALDLDGEVRWRRDLGGLSAGAFSDPTVQWGFASSPVLYRDRVFLQVDVHGGAWIGAWRLEDGEPLWRTPRDVAPSWATPVVFRGPDGDELIANGSVVRAYAPDTGRELWSLGPNSEMVVSTPVVGPGVVYVSAGYPPVKPIYAVRGGVRGAMQVEPGGEDERLLWSHERGGAYMPTPLLYRGLLYIVHYNARLVVYEAATGRAVSKQRFSRGGTFTASPVAADGRIYASTEEGLVYVLEAGVSPRELAVNELGEPLMASPALSEGRLLLRTPRHLVAVGSPADAP